MSDAAVFAIAQTMGPSFGGSSFGGFAVPSHDGRDRATYWLNAAYLGIGALSLTWPVAAFLRSL